MTDTIFINRENLDRIPHIKPTTNANTVVNDMNGFFISHFLKMMYNTTDNTNTDNAFGSSSGEEIFRGFLLNEQADILSHKFNLTTTMMQKYISPPGESSATKVDA